MLISRLLFNAAKHPAVGALVRFGFAYGSFLLPVRRVVNTGRVLAFYHPRPVYDDHIVIVPKKRIAAFLDLIVGNRVGFLVDILMAAREVVQTQAWDGFVLGVNGGCRQEVPQVHFHLYRKAGVLRPFSDTFPEEVLMTRDEVRVFQHPEPNEEVHVLICCPVEMAFESASPIKSADMAAALGCFPELDRMFSLVDRGYTVFVQGQELPAGCGLIFHVVSGKRLN